MAQAKIKNKKRKYFKYVICFLIIYISFSFTFYYSIKKYGKNNNTKFINLVLSGGNSHILNNYKLVSVVNSTIKIISNIDLTNPITIINKTIFKSSNNNTEITLHEDDYSNLEELTKISHYMEDPNKIDITKPLIYLYNTHQLENYNNENLAIYDITPNVLMASYILKEKLNKLGISTVVEDTNITEFLKVNAWNYASSYKASRILLLDKKSKYDTLKYFIDIHRDSSKDTKVTINNKKYAKILFVVGLEHPNYNDNIKVVEKLNNILKQKYPNISKGIYKKKGANVNGIYNQDIDSNVMLIEVGGVDNNIEEVLNTLEALSLSISQFVNDNG